jgi:hypothetical protein
MLGVVVALLGVFPVQAQKSAADGIAEYRKMLEDGNPADLFEAKGEALWKTARGPKNATLERCDLGKGPGVVKGAYAQMPRHFADADQVMDFESRVVHCMVTLQGFDRAAAVKNPYSGTGQRQTDIEALTAFAVEQSRGMPVAIPFTSLRSARSTILPCFQTQRRNQHFQVTFRSRASPSTALPANRVPKVNSVWSFLELTGPRELTTLSCHSFRRSLSWAAFTTAGAALRRPDPDVVFRQNPWSLTFVRRAVGWPASPNWRVELR